MLMSILITRKNSQMWKDINYIQLINIQENKNYDVVYIKFVYKNES